MMFNAMDQTVLSMHSVPQNTHLELLVVLPEHKRLFSEGRELLAARLGLRLPQAWPEFPEAFQPNASIESLRSEWPGYFFVSKHHQAIVGNGGFAGYPKEGIVEIGYEVAPEFRNLGFATKAVGAILAIAFAKPEIEAVIAHTLAEKNASNAVLEKVGMVFVGEFANSEVGAVWRWQVSRSSSQ
jgi:RimJ/RimL family protein N-acetyltransferase